MQPLIASPWCSVLKCTIDDVAKKYYNTLKEAKNVPL